MWWGLFALFVTFGVWWGVLRVVLLGSGRAVSFFLIPFFRACGSGGVWRINGDLCMSRSFGDPRCKPAVECRPDVRSISLSPSLSLSLSLSPSLSLSLSLSLCLSLSLTLSLYFSQRDLFSPFLGSLTQFLGSLHHTHSCY